MKLFDRQCGILQTLSKSIRYLNLNLWAGYALQSMTICDKHVFFTIYVKDIKWIEMRTYNTRQNRQFNREFKIHSFRLNCRIQFAHKFYVVCWMFLFVYRKVTHVIHTKTRIYMLFKYNHIYINSYEFHAARRKKWIVSSIF